MRRRGIAPLIKVEKIEKKLEARPKHRAHHLHEPGRGKEEALRNQEEYLREQNQERASEPESSGQLGPSARQLERDFYGKASQGGGIGTLTRMEERASAHDAATSSSSMTARASSSGAAGPVAPRGSVKREIEEVNASREEDHQSDEEADYPGPEPEESGPEEEEKEQGNSGSELEAEGKSGSEPEEEEESGSSPERESGSSPERKSGLDPAGIGARRATGAGTQRRRRPAVSKEGSRHRFPAHRRAEERTQPAEA